jgi:hypothetical protein
VDDTIHVEFCLVDTRTRGNSKLGVARGLVPVEHRIMLGTFKFGTVFTLKTILWVGSYQCYYFIRIGK